MTAISAQPTRFRFETDMAAGTIGHFLCSPELYVGAELEIGVRAPDLVFGQAEPAVLAARLAAGSALASELEVRLVERLLAQAASTEELKAWAPWGWRNLRETALASLADRGAIGCADDTWQVVADVRPPFRSLEAVELKLTDWRHGLRQAWHNRAFAERSWLITGNCVPPQQAVELAAASRIGLARLRPGGELEPIVEPISAPPLSQTAKRLARERLLAQLLEQCEPGGQKRLPLAGSPRGRQLVVGR
jgi:hypothetical protein